MNPQLITYLLFFCAAVVASSILTAIFKKISFKLGILDVPSSERKIHKQPIPLLGGFGIFFAFFLVLICYVFFFAPSTNVVPLKFYSGIAAGAIILMTGGLLDDKYNLPPRRQIIFPIIAVLAVLFSGIGVGINVISNPFGAPLSLSWKVIGIPASAILSFLFVFGMIYTTKILDGMDGLAGGITFIASLTLFFLSLTPKVNQPITATLAIILCGSVLGFLFYNFNPASIFLGESGSTFLGFMLGVLSILLGAKIATAVLVMGIPILDLAWVIMRRIYYHRPIGQADRKHLHFRLLDIGFSQKQTVLILYCISFVTGMAALTLQTRGKILALFILIIVMIALGLFTVVAYKRQNARIDE